MEELTRKKVERAIEEYDRDGKSAFYKNHKFRGGKYYVRSTIPRKKLSDVFHHMGLLV